MVELKDNLRVYWGVPEKDKVKRKLNRMSQVLKDARARFPGVEYVDLCYYDDGRILVKPLEPPKSKPAQEKKQRVLNDKKKLTETAKR